MRLFHSARLRWWGLSCAYVLLLYATLPLARPLVKWMRATLSDAGQNYLIYSIFAAVACAAVAFLFIYRKKLHPTAWVALLVIIRLYMLELFQLGTHPEERLHFIEYGVLALLLHRAFSIDLADVRPRGLWPYLGALALGAVIGWGDEGVQHLTQYIPDICAYFDVKVHPLTFRRYYDLRDVRLNFLGVSYGLAFLALVIRNRKTNMQLSPPSKPT